MKPFLIFLPMLLTGCLSIFEDEKPEVDTAARYADEVCSEAGRRSQACADARTQVSVRCYRTIGVVNCYTSEDPFGANGTARSLALPVDRRPLTPSPG